LHWGLFIFNPYRVVVFNRIFSPSCTGGYSYLNPPGLWFWARTSHPVEWSNNIQAAWAFRSTKIYVIRENIIAAVQKLMYTILDIM
jgi:hypothetical protein